MIVTLIARVGLDSLGQILISKSIFCIDNNGFHRTETKRLLADFFEIVGLLTDVDGQGNHFGLILVLNPLQHHARIETAGIQEDNFTNFTLASFV